MGKKKGRKFIDLKKDTVKTFYMIGREPSTRSSDNGPTKKKVQFQLRETYEAEAAANANSNAEEEPLPSTSSHNNVRFVGELANEITNDIPDYDIGFDDDYDYEQHLRDPYDNSAWMDEETEVCTIYTKKKDAAQNSRLLADNLPYEPPIREIAEDALEEEFSDPELFSDEEMTDDIPDNLFDILDGDEPTDALTNTMPVREDREEVAYANMPPLEQFSDEEEKEVDYTNMPPLEQFSDEDDASSNFSMEVSDEEDDCSNGGGASTSELKETIIPVKSWLSDTAGPSSGPYNETHPASEMDPDKLDRFFESVGGELSPSKRDVESDDEDLPHMRSSRHVKSATRQLEILNERFEHMWVKEYGQAEIEAPLYDPDNLGRDAQSLLSISKQDKRHFMQQRVFLTGPNKLEETPEEEELKTGAIKYCKNWKKSKLQYEEVEVPDPKSMEFNAANVPSIRNKNNPKIIDINPSKLFNEQKKKGLSIKALKLHDQEMNTPGCTADEDTQTYKTMLSELSYRPPDETAEERRERKGAVKELRKGRREEKKFNRIAHRIALVRTANAQINAKHCKTIPML